MPVPILIVPLFDTLIPLPIFTPPNLEIVAVCNIYGVAVVALITPSFVMLIPMPILTPPSLSDLAIGKLYDVAELTLIVPSFDKSIPEPILIPPNLFELAVGKVYPKTNPFTNIFPVLDTAIVQVPLTIFVADIAELTNVLVFIHNVTSPVEVLITVLVPAMIRVTELVL